MKKQINLPCILRLMATYFTFEELKEKIKDLQTDKDDKLVVLYASDKEAQHSYIEAAKAKGFEVLLVGLSYCFPS